jgi:hypothetical protein
VTFLEVLTLQRTKGVNGKIFSDCGKYTETARRREIIQRQGREREREREREAESKTAHPHLILQGKSSSMTTKLLSPWPSHPHLMMLLVQEKFPWLGKSKPINWFYVT